ncbi:ribosome biogenesis GTPase Der [Thermodesulfobacteriota bacterium]
MTSIIAIVGRPNVGKSTLFNRLLRFRSSIVDDHPGITRDRLYSSIEWADRAATVIDTGGFEDLGQDPLIDQVKDQTLKAVDEADIIIFMVEGPQGILPGDQELAGLLRRSQKKVFLAVNKIDGPEHDSLVSEFYGLGLKRIYPLSAAHGYGFKPLMNRVMEELPSMGGDREPEGRIRVAVVGRPNAGKSSLINRILGFDRLLTSPQPGTTRDSVDTLFDWKGSHYLLIDTAGIRRKSRVKEKVQKYSMIKALRSLSRCHIAVILFDASRGIADQDARILGYALERGRGIILAVNKWDLVKGDPAKKRFFNNDYHRQLKFVSFAPRINLSALTGERVKVLLDKISGVYSQFNRRLSTATVNRAVQELVDKKPPPRIGRGELKFYYATQTAVRPPTFVVFANKPEKIHFSYRRFMINQVRKRLHLDHTPIRLLFRKR